VCHQTVSLVARHLEANGIPTVMLASARDITASAFPPRALFVNYPLGNTAGRPFDPANQRAIVSQTLDVLETATRPGVIVDTPHRWRQDDGWMERVYDENH
jgi:hypothetical protein